MTAQKLYQTNMEEMIKNGHHLEVRCEDLKEDCLV